MNEDDRPLIVFLGPTLAVADAKKELPNALYLPPARCGDVLQSLRLAPRALLIIDGTYEQTPAIWHKEIGLVLERNIPIFGAASMGALRAAEMAAFGMIGVGGIFRDYRDGKLVDDDEVAVIHTRAGEPLSQAMVDIRATINRAVDQGALPHDAALAIVATAKRMFYPERSIEAACKQVSIDQPFHTNDLSRFADWILLNGRVNRKRDDAIEALRALAQHPFTLPREEDALLAEGIKRTLAPTTVVPRTSKLRVLLRHVACSAFHGENIALPRAERVVQAARFLGQPYVEAKRLAQILSTLFDIATTREQSVNDGPTLTDVDVSSDLSGLWPPAMDASTWALENDCSEVERLALRDRIRSIARLEKHTLRPPAEPHMLLSWRAITNVNRYERWLAAIDDDDSCGPTPTSLPAGKQHSVRQWAARAWRMLDMLARQASLIPTGSALEGILYRIRLEVGLIEPADLDRWLEKHNLGVSRLRRLPSSSEETTPEHPYELAALLVARCRLDVLALHASPILSSAEHQSDEDVHWLLDALRVSGLYPQARRLLELEGARRERAVILPKTQREAVHCDFDSDDPLALRRALLAL